MKVNARTACRLLAGWTAAWFAGMAWHGALAGHFFVQDAQALADADDPAGGLRQHVVAPVLQIGPSAFLVTQYLPVLGSRSDLLAAQVLGAGARGGLERVHPLASRTSRPALLPWLVLFWMLPTMRTG